MERYFNPKEVADFIGISPRQLQYWDSSGFIQPSLRRRGRYRFYSDRDLFRLRVAKVLRERGLSIQKIRTQIAHLDRLLARTPETSVAELEVLVRGQEVMVFTGRVLMSESLPGLVRISGAEFSRDLEALAENLDRPDCKAS